MQGVGICLPLGWALLTLALAQIAVVMGWGEWFPWAVPSLFSDFSGQHTAPGLHSYLMVLLVSLIGLAAAFTWWLKADQTR